MRQGESCAFRLGIYRSIPELAVQITIACKLNREKRVLRRHIDKARHLVENFLQRAKN